MQAIATEILVHARQVTPTKLGDAYEFILNNELKVLECVKIASLIRGSIVPIKNSTKTLDGLLFELNHVRVNPKLDNSIIIGCLMKELENVGVRILKTPAQNSMATCFKPLGEISDNVRFYLNHRGNLIFLSPAMPMRLISSR